MNRVIVADVITGLIFAGIAPFLAGFVFMVPPGSVIALVLATLIVEYGAVFIGTGLGVDSAATLIIVTLVATGIIIFQLSLFAHIGNSSPAVSRFLEGTRKKYGSSPLIKKYGVFALIPGMLVVGFYICPAVSCLLGWERRTAFFIMIITFCAASVLLLPVSEGLFTWLSGLHG